MKMLISFLLSLVTTAAFAAPVIFSGSDVKTLKPNIDLNGQSKILSGTVDPTATATSAPIGSIYLNSSSGMVYRKLDSGSSTNWALATTGAIAQASYFGGMEQTTGGANCSFSESTSTGLSNFVTLGTGTTCNAWTTEGGISAVSSNSSSFTATNMGVGSYLIQFIGAPTVSATGNCNWRLTDGTNNYQAQPSQGAGISSSSLQFQVTTTTPGTRTYQVQAADNITGSCYLDSSFTGSNAAWKVYYFPTQAQTVLTPALTPAYAGKQWLGASLSDIKIGVSTAPSSTRTTFTQTNLATYTLLGSAQNDSSQNFQVTATLPAGEYEVEFTGLMRSNAAASGTGTTCLFELYDGTSAIGSNYITSSAQAAFNTQDAPHIRGYFKLSGSTTKTISVRAAKAFGDSSASSFCEAYVDAATGSTSSAMLTIAPRTQTVPMPVLANSVISSSAGVTRIESATFVNTGSACNSAVQNGSWTTATRSSAGVCNHTFSPAFSSAPSCVVTDIQGGSFSNYCRIDNNSTTATGVSVLCISGGAASDQNYSIMCHGPK